MVIRANREPIMYLFFQMHGRSWTGVQMQESRLCQNDLQEFGQTFPACRVSKQELTFECGGSIFFAFI